MEEEEEEEGVPMRKDEGDKERGRRRGLRQGSTR